MDRKFKVGDKVVWDCGNYRLDFYPYCPPDAILTVVGYRTEDGIVVLKTIAQMEVEAYDWRFKLYEGDGASDVAETPNETKRYTCFYPSIIVSEQNPSYPTSSIMEAANAIKITTVNHGDKKHIQIERGSGYVTLDVDSLDAVFSAIKTLLEQQES